MSYTSYVHISKIMGICKKIMLENKEEFPVVQSINVYAQSFCKNENELETYVSIFVDMRIGLREIVTNKCEALSNFSFGFIPNDIIDDVEKILVKTILHVYYSDYLYRNNFDKLIDKYF